jgi:SAM-dependent methyltransferase
MSGERDYVLGTHDEEIDRLGLQHVVWRPRALDAWRRAGFTRDQRLIDFGAGPGYATVDLADIVGPNGQIIALDRSRRFLDRLEAVAESRRLTQVRTIEIDLAATVPTEGADGAWCRWIFAFLPEPRAALERLAAAIRPGGRLVIHEYLDYATWRLFPRSVAFERFVEAVMESWRTDGGESDIGPAVACWLSELGWQIELQPIIDIVSPENLVWRWPSSFVTVNSERLVSLGRLAGEDAAKACADLAAAETRPGTLMATPTLLEIIAKKPR